MLHLTILVFSTYEKMQGLRLIKFSPENIYLKACSASFSQNTEGFISDIHPELLSGMLKVNRCSGHDLIFVEVDGKCQVLVDRATSWS